MELHCSPLGRVLACNPSLVAPAVAISTESPEAALGTAVHAALSAMVRDARPPDPYDDPSYAYLVASGKKIWASLIEHIGGVQAEVQDANSLGCGHTLTGTADVVAETSDGKECVILDWKTGAEVNTTDQLMGYAYLFAEERPARLITAWLREGITEVQAVSYPEIEAWAAALRETLEHPSAAYHPGEHCAFCPRAHECPARTAMAQSACRDLQFAMGTGTGGELVDLKRAGELYSQSRIVNKTLDNFEKAVDSLLDEHGSIPLPNGKQLVRERRGRETIHYTPSAAEILAGLNVIPTVSKKSVEAAAGKGAFKLLGALRDAGAIELSTFFAKVERKEAKP